MVIASCISQKFVYRSSQLTVACEKILQFRAALVGQRIIFSLGSNLGGAVFRLRQPVFLQPQQQRVERSLRDLAKAVIRKPFGDLIAIGRRFAECGQNTALERAFEQL